MFTSIKKATVACRFCADNLAVIRQNMLSRAIAKIENIHIFLLQLKHFFTLAGSSGIYSQGSA
jgi:hypothetical protein